MKGKPRLILRGGNFADYTSGSGGKVLVFGVPAGTRGEAVKLDLNRGAIIASEAGAMPRIVAAQRLRTSETAGSTF